MQGKVKRRRRRRVRADGRSRAVPALSTQVTSLAITVYVYLQLARKCDRCLPFIAGCVTNKYLFLSATHLLCIGHGIISTSRTFIPRRKHRKDCTETAKKSTISFRTDTERLSGSTNLTHFSGTNEHRDNGSVESSAGCRWPWS